MALFISTWSFVKLILTNEQINYALNLSTPVYLS